MPELFYCGATAALRIAGATLPPTTTFRLKAEAWPPYDKAAAWPQHSMDLPVRRNIRAQTSLKSAQSVSGSNL
jgi:hypothetical protein